MKFCMISLKRIQKITILFFVCVMAFCFFSSKSFAAISTEDACVKNIPVGVCKDKCPNEWNAGTCGSTGKTCCIEYQKDGDKCGYSLPLTGTCRPESFVPPGNGCKDTEKELARCIQKTPYLSKLTCCVPKNESAVPGGSDTVCSKACGGKYKCVLTSCPDDFPKQYGTCEATMGGSGFGQKCCIPDSCTPTPGNVTSGSGSSALDYSPLENLPGFEGSGGDLPTYLNNLYLLVLWIVAISALFMLVVGGFLYLSSAGNTHVLGTAKKTIVSALIGLVIALLSWLILDTINSDLTTINLSGVSGGLGGSNSSNVKPLTPMGPLPPAGSGSGCSGISTQGGIGSQCSDASQALSDTLKCMADKLGADKMEISSISHSLGFSTCQNNYVSACEHEENSCHFGGKNKAPKSCAADISTNGSSASDSDISKTARECGTSFVKNEGNHIHISVQGCVCDGHS